ncbi:hypothetical protein [Mycobacterium sp. 1465703.0]|uniref:hypothetical protein n=1 Tax=Mycobacterium sp. 1465703.0 TaxID=1834078 RepID=UPI0007FD4FD0|nr:hypothetical protein [Mycobacterium sp. 1465703.0]OBJ08281.1 hypothetical protein A5625_15295 [Mycobacterium sp. 1465703.0]
MPGTAHGHNPIQPPDASAAPAVSDDDKAKARAAAAEAAKGKPGDKFVLYLGPSNITRNKEDLKKRSTRLGEGTYAEITPQQWAAVGISAKAAVKWTVANNWRVPVSAFTDEQLDYLLTNSKRFELIDGEGNPAER